MKLLSDKCTFLLKDPYVNPSLGSGEGYKSIKISSTFDKEDLDPVLGFDQNQVGSILVSWIDPDIWAEQCATPLHYLALRRGYEDLHATLCDYGNLTDLSDEELEHLVEKMRTRPSFRWMATFKPKKALAIVQEEHQERWQIAVDQLVGQPYVEYIKVRKNFRQQGLAKALYALAGCYMATKGYTLRGSTCQHYKASAAWESMVRDLSYPTHRIQLDDRLRFLLDYRQQPIHRT